MIYKCLSCNEDLIQGKHRLLSDPPQYGYKCNNCDKRYLITEGKDNLHLHFDQQYGGE